MNLLGRGFAGFGAMETYDSRNAVWDTRNYSRAFPYTGMINYELADLNNTSAQSIKLVNIIQAADTLSTSANNERYFPYDSDITTKIYEVGGTESGDLITTTSTNYSYDNSGNATTVAATVTDNDPASPYVTDTWMSTTVNAITPTTSTWCLNLPTQTTVTNSVNLPGGGAAPGGASIARTVQYVNPDYTNCRETEKVTAPGTAYQVTENYVYDNSNGGTAFGDLTSDTITGVGMAARTTTITWNSTGQFPQTIQNPLLQSITLGFDPNTGMKLSQTDPNFTSSNPLTTSWQYDGFARKTKEIRPDGTSTTWAYNACGCGPIPPLIVVEQVWDTGGNQSNVMGLYYDKLDRQVYQTNVLPNSTWVWTMDRQFDSLGRVQSEDFLSDDRIPSWGSDLYV